MYTCITPESRARARARRALTILCSASSAVSTHLVVVVERVVSSVYSTTNIDDIYLCPIMYEKVYLRDLPICSDCEYMHIIVAQYEYI